MMMMILFSHSLFLNLLFLCCWFNNFFLFLNSSFFYTWNWRDTRWVTSLFFTFLFFTLTNVTNTKIFPLFESSFFFFFDSLSKDLNPFLHVQTKTFADIPSSLSFSAKRLEKQNHHKLLVNLSLTLLLRMLRQMWKVPHISLSSHANFFSLTLSLLLSLPLDR